VEYGWVAENKKATYNCDLVVVPISGQDACVNGFHLLTTTTTGQIIS
jgi:hypothetical protein